LAYLAYLQSDTIIRASIGQQFDAGAYLHNLAKLIFPLDARERLIIVLAAYFDLSQGVSPVVCMVGYVSTVPQWVKFSRLWVQAINKAGISCFHMTDFVARVPPFDKLTESERGRLMRRLVRLMNKYPLMSFDVSMLKSDFEELFKEREHIIRSPWVWLAISVASAVGSWARMSGHSEPIAFFFDRGDKYSGEFKNAYDFLLKDQSELFKQIVANFQLGPLVLGDRCREVPLQAADVFAYETWRYRSSALKKPDAVMRRSFQYLTKSPHFSQFIDREWLSQVIDRVGWRDEH
jgi:hypothetical protein